MRPWWPPRRRKDCPFKARFAGLRLAGCRLAKPDATFVSRKLSRIEDLCVRNEVAKFRAPRRRNLPCTRSPLKGELESAD